MIIVNENKLKIGVFGVNTEKILILQNGFKVSKDIDGDTEDEIEKVNYQLSSVNYNDVIAGKKVKHGVIKDLDKLKKGLLLPENYELNNISALKLLSKNFFSLFGLEEGTDFELKTQISWEHETMSARVSIPTSIILENEALSQLQQHVKGLIAEGNAFKIISGNLYIFYFKKVLPEHLAILEAPEVKNSILVEIKK